MPSHTQVMTAAALLGRNASLEHNPLLLWAETEALTPATPAPRDQSAQSFLARFAAEGFEVCHSDRLPACGDHHEEHHLLFNAEHGLFAAFYADNGKTLDAKIFFNWQPAPGVDTNHPARGVLGNSLTRPDKPIVGCVSTHTKGCADELFSKLDVLKSNGTFLPRWDGAPYITLYTGQEYARIGFSGQQHFNAECKRITEERLARVPQPYRDAMGI